MLLAVSVWIGVGTANEKIRLAILDDWDGFFVMVFDVACLVSVVWVAYVERIYQKYEKYAGLFVCGGILGGLL